MRVTEYFLYTEHTQNMKISTDLTIDLKRENPQEPLKVAIGIDASTTTTGVTIGSSKEDFPFIFLEYRRDKDESINMYLNEVLNTLTYRVVMNNNLKVEHIFVEDKYEDKRRYSRRVLDALATVKVVMRDLPQMITQATGSPTPKYHLMLPQTWRKYYLGDLNTNKGRDYMKRLVADFGQQRYNFHPQCVGFNDLMDSIGIYSAGIKAIVKPDSKDNVIAEVILNNIDWAHHIEMKVFYKKFHKDVLKDIVSQDMEMRGRIQDHGLKMFEYYRGVSVEKNIRSLTTNSNAVFACFLDSNDMEAVPLYYETKSIPEIDDSVIIVGYRKNLKRGE